MVDHRHGGQCSRLEVQECLIRAAAQAKSDARTNPVDTRADSSQSNVGCAADRWTPSAGNSAGDRTNTHGYTHRKQAPPGHTEYRSLSSRAAQSSAKIPEQQEREHRDSEGDHNAAGMSSENRAEQRQDRAGRERSGRRRSRL